MAEGWPAEPWASGCPVGWPSGLTWGNDQSCEMLTTGQVHQLQVQALAHLLMELGTLGEMEEPSLNCPPSWKQYLAGERCRALGDLGAQAGALLAARTPRSRGDAQSSVRSDPPQRLPPHLLPAKAPKREVLSLPNSILPIAFMEACLAA